MCKATAGGNVLGLTLSHIMFKDNLMLTQW